MWLLLVVLAGAAAADPQEGPQVRKWREDLAVLREQMPKSHGNLFHTMTRAQFDGALDALEGALPGLTDSQVKLGIMQLVAMVGDGHTRVRLESLGNHALPVRLHFFADGLYVVSAARTYADLVGGRVKKIGVMPVEDAYGAVRPLVSVDADNEGRRRLLAVNLLVMPEVLHAIGAISGTELVELTVDKGGRETTRTVSAGLPGSWSDPGWPMEPQGWVGARERAANPPPPWLQHPEKHYWHAFLHGGRTLYVQYNQVEDEPGGEPISVYFPHLFAQADRQGVQRVIIDVRLNGGGNNELNRPIWHALLRSDHLNQKGRLWVLIGPKTFSAAMNFVDDMELNTRAMFVGEPTGETPNMWGDPVRLTLPNSGIVIQTSTLWWQLEDPRDQRAFRAPDIPAQMRFADYANNVDPVLNAIP
ncbi:MAG TPA: hypothetical protein VLV29_06425 [Steroidobacteraceae bacterium]|nr:hypothetical protein [Steroidobacteraceae bacterium]